MVNPLPQQAPLDPAFLQKALLALRAQRENAADAAAVEKARADLFEEQVASLQAQLDAMKKDEPK